MISTSKVKIRIFKNPFMSLRNINLKAISARATEIPWKPGNAQLRDKHMLAWIRVDAKHRIVFPSPIWRFNQRLKRRWLGTLLISVLFPSCFRIRKNSQGAGCIDGVVTNRQFPPILNPVFILAAITWMRCTGNSSCLAICLSHRNGISSLTSSQTAGYRLQTRMSCVSWLNHPA